MWQTIESKAAGIEQFRKGDNLARTIDDVASEAGRQGRRPTPTPLRLLRAEQVAFASE